MKEIIKKMLYYITTVVIIVGLYILYYYYPRNISFELTMKIQKPNEKFDQSDWISYNYISDENRLMFFLVEWGKGFPDREYLIGYDSVFV